MDGRVALKQSILSPWYAILHIPPPPSRRPKMSIMQFTEKQLRKSNNMEEKLWILGQCFLPSPSVPTIDLQPRRYFGFSIPSLLSLDTLQECIDNETEVVEIGAGLGLYAYIFNNPIFCKRWIATDHPETFEEWLPEGNRQPFTTVYHTRAPLRCFSPDTPPSKRVLITIWPEPESTYFWEDYVKHFDGDTVIIIGSPGVTGKEEMWDWLSEAYAGRQTTVPVSRISIGAFYDHESIYIWRRRHRGTLMYMPPAQ
jgi:hypothetical protein